jgi:hypothetical protein
MNFSTGKPEKSGIYIVDRGMQGKPFRFYNAETDQWGRCAYEIAEAVDSKSSVGFFPWAGPVTHRPEVAIEKAANSTPKPKKRQAATVALAPSQPKPKVVKAKKVKYPDFTIVHRPDRNGFEGWYGGKAEAFRDTVEKVQSFFQKKYQKTGQLLK